MAETHSTDSVIWLAAGVRTPFVKVDGTLSKYDAIDLSVPVVRAMLDQLGGANPDFTIYIPRAWYGIRARLDQILPQMPPSGTLIFTSSDGVLAKLATLDFMKSSSASVLALDGGTVAWRKAGFAMEQGPTRMATPPDDIRLRAREQGEKVEDAMREYLSWEINLADQMDTDDDQRFRILAG